MRAAWTATLRRWNGLLSSLLVLALLGGCQTIHNSKLLLPATWTGLEEVAPDVRVEASASADQRAHALQMRNDAFRRLVDVMGTVSSQPIHVFCFTEDCFQRFGGGSPRAKAFGDVRTLIGPAGLTTAYVAHEWWHIELHHRVGYWVVRKLPRWFDEGVAVWVSDDPRYGEPMYQRVLAQGIVPPKLDELETMDGFIAAVGRYGDHLWASKPADAVTVVYPTAAHEVRRWMDVVGVAGLRELVRGLTNGESFTALYRGIELQARAREN